MKKINLIILTFLILVTTKLHALIEVDITRGNLNPLPIAVSALYSDNETIEALKKEINVDEIGNEISLVREKKECTPFAGVNISACTPSREGTTPSKYVIFNIGDNKGENPRSLSSDSSTMASC